jgi:GTP-binding protein
MTKTINHFLINGSWYLVDLPGYGYAKASKGTQGAWLGFTKEYFLGRDALVSALLLVDASVPPQAIDLECAGWLAGSEVRRRCPARRLGARAPRF